MATFHDAGRVVASRLNPSTPLGFFRVLDPLSKVRSFWIVERGGDKSAIILEASDPRWRFEAFPLVDDDNAWTGVSLGPVEVMVDLEAGEFVDSPRHGRGAITITGGKVYVSAVPSGQLGSRVTFQVGTAVPSEEQASAIFGRWRLIQRLHNGEPSTLFEYD